MTSSSESLSMEKAGLSFSWESDKSNKTKCIYELSCTADLTDSMVNVQLFYLPYRAFLDGEYTNANVYK